MIKNDTQAVFIPKEKKPEDHVYVLIIFVFDYLLNFLNLSLLFCQILPPR